MTSRDKVIAGAVVACVGLLCLTVAGIFMSADKWHDLGRLLTTPPGTGSALGLALVVLGGMWAARHTPAPALLLALVLGATTLSGCTGADFAKALDVARPIVKWTCGLSAALCEKGDGAEACAAVAAFCGVVPPVLDAIPTSGGEASETEPRTLDEE